MTTLQQTPLYDLHQQLGAKMTAFAGYAMPVHYEKGIIHEHLHCRAEAGLFDISHMGQCRISGDGAVEALERLTPCGIIDLPIGGQKYTVLTNEQGGVIDDIMVTRSQTGVSLIVNAACKAKDFAHLRQHLPPHCALDVCDELALLALQGPKAASVMAKFSSAACDLRFMQALETEWADVHCLISRSGYTGEDGFEISLPQAKAGHIARLLLAEEGVEPIGLGARDTLRLEAGLCLYGHELSETISPIEAGLSWLCHKQHTAFPGGVALVTQRSQGAERVRVGLAVTGKIPVREGAVILDGDGRERGYVTSGSFAPSLGRPVAMALLEATAARSRAPLFARVRDQRIAVEVCPLPFVPHRYRR